MAACQGKTQKGQMSRQSEGVGVRVHRAQRCYGEVEQGEGGNHDDDSLVWCLGSAKAQPRCWQSDSKGQGLA